MEGVLFDLDGVLIRSEELALKAWNEFLGGFGWELSDEHFKRMIGSDDSAGYVLKHYPLEMSHEALRADHWKRGMRLIETELETQPGAEEILQDIQGRGIPLVIASNSPQYYVEKVLQISGLQPYFQAVVNRDMVLNPKPAPDVYRLAARMINLSPERCLAVEDSLIGMQAALAAGTRCVVVPQENLRHFDFTSAYARYDSLDDVRLALGSLLR
jgi:HAD superfamily hydrolase (TIGR01509 family)